jgi:hypothetical protein
LKRLLSVAGLVIAVALVVLFAPGLRNYIEGRLLTWLVGLAR